MDACVSATNDLSVPTDFNGWWNLRGESVEPANVRRDGESGVERLVLPLTVQEEPLL